MATRVYAYGCGDPTEGLEAALEEHERQVDLWDHLVDIDNRHDERVRELAARQSTDVAAAIARVTALSEQIDPLIQERRRIRKEARARVKTPLDTQLDDLFMQRKRAYREMGAAMKQWRKDNPESAKWLEDQRYTEMPKCKDVPLYWANFNSVMDRYKTGRKVARKNGKRLRKHDPRREDGLIAVQIQRTKSGLGCAPEELTDGAVSQLQIGWINPVAWSNNTPRGERRRLCRTVVEMRIDRAGNVIRLPMWYDRPLPPEGRVKAAELVWRREGHKIKWQLCITVSGLPEPEQSTRPKCCGIDVGWRMDEGGLLIATLYDSCGHHERLYLPIKWWRLQGKIEAASRRLKRSFNLAQRWAQGRADEIVIEAFKSGSYRRAHEAIMLHRDARLMQWRRVHKRLADIVDATRAKQLRRRREMFRLWAYRVAKEYGLVRIEQVDLASMALRKRTETSEEEMPGQVRKQRQYACVHQLLDEVAYQCTKTGTLLERYEGASTMLCHHCGEITGQRNRADRRWICEHCGVEWDQDINAAINLCRADASGDVLKKPGS